MQNWREMRGRPVSRGRELQRGIPHRRGDWQPSTLLYRGTR